MGSRSKVKRFTEEAIRTDSIADKLNAIAGAIDELAASVTLMIIDNGSGDRDENAANAITLISFDDRF